MRHNYCRETRMNVSFELLEIFSWFLLNFVASAFVPLYSKSLRIFWTYCPNFNILERLRNGWMNLCTSSKKTAIHHTFLRQGLSKISGDFWLGKYMNGPLGFYKKWFWSNKLMFIQIKINWKRNLSFSLKYICFDFVP